jgi:putative FmdB family regulatory protein
MPTYEYACSECHHQWEEIQRISEPPVEVCPACKKVAAQRLISAGNFILKGGGWYADLYSSAKPKSGSNGGKTESKATETTRGESKSGESKSGESKSGESKSADAKTETKAASTTPPTTTSS